MNGPLNRPVRPARDALGQTLCRWCAGQPRCGLAGETTATSRVIAGLMFISAGEMEAALRQVFSCGLQAGVHAIGDAANRQVLDAYETGTGRISRTIPAGTVSSMPRYCIRMIIPRFAELGVIAAMQPTHATSDMYWADERLGPERLAGAYAWRSLLDSGASAGFRLGFSGGRGQSDAGYLRGGHAARTRQAGLKGAGYRTRNGSAGKRRFGHLRWMRPTRASWRSRLAPWRPVSALISSCWTVDVMRISAAEMIPEIQVTANLAGR